jgi:hypothetical protein
VCFGVSSTLAGQTKVAPTSGLAVPLWTASAWPRNAVPSITGNHLAVAEDERDAIVGRIKTAVASAKALGTRPVTTEPRRRRKAHAHGLYGAGAQFTASVYRYSRLATSWFSSWVATTGSAPKLC